MVCSWDFSGCPVVKTSPSNQGVQVWSPVGELSLAAKHKSKQDYSKFNKDFKNGPYQKILKKKKKDLLEVFFLKSISFIFIY